MRNRRTVSRSVDHLLTDFGANLPRKEAPLTEPPADKLFPKVIHRRGVRRTVRIRKTSTVMLMMKNAMKP